MPTEQNPILNNPYEEPGWHYATNLAGELDYSRPVKGRRIFTPEVQSIPVRQGAQGDLMELNEVAAADYGCRSGEPLNLLLEITGMSRDKEPKKWTVANRWLPAVNRIREQNGWDKWDFLEVTNETALADLRNILLQKLSQPPAFGIWRHEPVDAIAHQKKIRSEWEGE